MIVVKLTGGLGNQMFQYAFAKSLSLKKRKSFLLDANDFKYDALRNFELDLFHLGDKLASPEIIRISKIKQVNRFRQLINKVFQRRPKNEVFIENDLDYNSDIESVKLNYYHGYWQTEKYFKQFEKEIRNDFQMQIEPNEYYLEMIQAAKNTESVSVHFRRSDFANNPETNQFHGLCDLTYYKKAMEYIKGSLDNVTFFMISDDIEWVKNEFQNESNIIYIENYKGKDYEDMRLMSNCKHNIIANSSFSWWGAWLNENTSKIVVSPSRWFKNEEKQQQTKDLIPENWIKL